MTDRGATHTHAWGANVGAFVYAFSCSPRGWTKSRVSARLSSEHPWYSAPQNHFSDVTLVVNGREYPSQRVAPDDGSGRMYEWAIDPADLREGDNELRLSVKRVADYRHGMCIYADPAVPGAEVARIVVDGM